MNNQGNSFLVCISVSEVTIEPCLRNLSEETIAEFSIRLQSDKVLRNQFYHSFGLVNPQPKKVFISKIGELFPDTPIKLVIDVCRALQLYDLVELLERPIKPRTLRPALPLKEIAKLVSYSNRPTTSYSKVKIVFVGDDEKTFDTIENFFKKSCPGSKISRSKPNIDRLEFFFERSIELAMEKEDILERIKQIEHQEGKGKRLYGRPQSGKISLEKRRDQIEKELLQVNGELEAEKTKIESDIFSAFDKSWGEESGKIFIS